MRGKLLALFVVGLLMVACGGESPGSAEAMASSAPRWQIDPVVRIGSLDDPDQILTRVTQVLIGPDDELFVAQPLDQRILVYDAEGQLVGPIGRGGEGPGEFGRLGRIGLRGDTLHAADSGLRRVTFFTRAGDLLGSVRWASPSIRDGRFVQLETPPQVLLSDGSGLVEPFYSYAVRAGETGTQTLAIPGLFLRLERDAEEVDTLAMTETHFTTTTVSVEGDPVRIRCPFEASPLGELLLDGAGVVLIHRPFAETLEPSTFQMTVVDPRGDTTVSRSVTYEPVPMSDAVVDEAIAAIRTLRLERDQPAPTAGQVRDAWEDIDCSPVALSPVEEIVPAQDGGFWLKAGALPGDSVAWSRYDGSGENTGRIQLPPTESIIASEGETLVTLELDEFDVPYLNRYRVVR